MALLLSAMHTLVSPLAARILERVTHDAVHTLEGVDFLLQGDLILGARLEAPAHADIYTFGVLAKHDEVDVTTRPVLQWTQSIVEQSHRSIVDVEVELEPGAEQDVARMPVVGYARITKRSDEDGLELLTQPTIAIGRQRFTSGEKVISAPRQVNEIQRLARRRATASRTLTASAVTSLPMPSPGITAIRMKTSVTSYKLQVTNVVTSDAVKAPGRSHRPIAVQEL